MPTDEEARAAAWSRVARWTGTLRCIDTGVGTRETVEAVNIDVSRVLDDTMGNVGVRWIGTAETTLAWTHRIPEMWSGSGKGSGQTKAEFSLDPHGIDDAGKTGVVLTFGCAVPDATAERTMKVGGTTLTAPYTPTSKFASRVLGDPPVDRDTWTFKGTGTRKYGTFSEKWSWNLQAHPGIGKVTVWLNVFIAGNMPGVTKRVPGSGEHGGKTMIHSTRVGDCFLTDQRSFNDDPGASVRVQMLGTFDCATGEFASSVRSGLTVEVDCEDGEEEGRASAKTAGLKWLKPAVRRKDGAPIGCKVRLKGKANDPLVAASAVVSSVDFSGLLDVSSDDEWRTAVVRFSGIIEEWPHYEIYARADDGKPVKVLQHAARGGASAFALMGAAGTGVEGSARLKVGE